MADTPSLILTTVEVDTTKGTASLKQFEKQVESTATASRASLGKLDKSMDPFDKLMADAKASTTALEKSIIDARNSGVAAGGALAGAFSLVTLGVAAVAAGAYYAVKGLNAFAEAADRVTDIKVGFDTLTRASGGFGEEFLTKMRAATQGLVSDTELMRMTSKALLREIPVTADTLSDLAGQSLRLGKAMGVDSTRAAELLTEGIGRQSTMMLKQIGISIRAGDAYREYADSLGKTVSSLTEAERLQAFYNAVVVEAKTKSDALSATLPTLTDEWRKLGVAVSNAKAEMLVTTNLNIGKNLVQGQQANEFNAAAVAAEREAAVLKLQGELIEANFKKLEVYNASKDKFTTPQLGAPVFSENLSKLDVLTKALDANRIKLDDSRASAARLTQMLQETNDVDMQKLIQVSLAGVENEINNLLGVAKEAKLSLDEIANIDFKAGRHLPGVEPDQPTTIPSSPTPGEGDFIEDLDKALVRAIEDAIDLKKQLQDIAEAQTDLSLQSLSPLGRQTVGGGSSKEVEKAKQIEDQVLIIKQAALADEALFRAAEIQAMYDKELAMAAVTGEKEVAIEERKNLRLLLLRQRLAEKSTAIIKDSQQRQMAIQQQNIDSQIQGALEIAGAASSAISSIFGHTKAGAIATAVINAAAAVVAALAQIPYPYNFVVAAITTAAAQVQISKINSASLGGSGSVTAPSAPSVNFGGAARTPTNAPVSGNTPVSSNSSQEIQVVSPQGQQSGSQKPALNLTVNVSMLDARSAKEWLTSPEISRHVADAYDTYTSRT